MTGPEALPEGFVRRAHPRHPVQIAGTAWVVARVATAPFKIEATDVSLGGMMLHGTSGAFPALEAGDEFLIGFPIDHSKERVSVRGTLAWKRMGFMTLLGDWSFGIRFHDTPESELRKLLDVAELQRATQQKA
jgi:hypothetical protein